MEKSKKLTLKEYLEQEKQQALNLGDFALAMAIGLLFVGIAEYLSGYFLKRK